MNNTTSELETLAVSVDCIPFNDLFTNETTTDCRPAVSSGFESSFISRHRTATMVVCLTAVLASVCFNVILISRLIQRPGIIASARNALLLNLATADLLLSLTYNAAILHRMRCERWPLGPHGCVGYGFGLAIFGCVRNATLSMFSIERILFIDRKLNEVKNQSLSQFPVSVMRDREFRKYACLLVTSSWLLSLLLTLPLLLGSSAFEVDDRSLICALNSTNRDIFTVCYRLAYFIVGSLLPLSVNYGTYRAFGDKVDHIVRLLEQKNRRQSSLIRLAVRISHNSRLSTVSRRSVSSVSSVVLRDLNKSTRRRPLTDEVVAEKRVTRLLTVIGAASMVSCLPYGLLAVSASLADGSQADWLTVTSGLQVLMSSLHPIVLLLFRDQLKLRPLAVLCRRPLSSATVSVFPTASAASSRDNRKLTTRTTRFHSAPNASFCGSPLPRGSPPPLSLTPITESNSFALFSASPAIVARSLSSAQWRPTSVSDNADRLSLTDIRSTSPTFSSAVLSPFHSPGARSHLSPGLASSPAASRPSPSHSRMSSSKVERFFGESLECIRSRNNSMPDITPTLTGRLSSAVVGPEVEGTTDRTDEATMMADSMEHSRMAREKQTIVIMHQTNKLDGRQLPYVA